MIYDTVEPVVTTFTNALVRYLPNFFGGLLILAIGLVLSQILKKILVSFFGFFKFDEILKRTKLASGQEIKVWEQILAELLSWSVIILFLIPAAEVWGLSKVTIVLQELLSYLPNVLVAVVIGFVGIIAANLVSDIIRHSVRSMGSTSANTLSVLSRYAIFFFTILVAMNQLGIAQDLIRILFTGIVAMLAIAGGLAFGMGGRDMARDILEEFRKKI